MPASAPRIAPLEPPYDPPAQDELARWMPSGTEEPPLALFRTLCANPALAQAMRPFGTYLLSKRSGIDLVTRELIIARVCANNGCSYEWGVHVTVFGAAAGLSPKQIEATATPQIDEAIWPPREAAVLHFVDALCEQGSVSDAEWGSVAKHFDDAQMLTLLALAGFYHVISFVANGARTPMEHWAPILPANARSARNAHLVSDGDDRRGVPHA